MSDNVVDKTSWASSKWLSKTAAAKYIHRSPAALQQLLDSGEIPASQAPFERGGAAVVYISIDDLDSYMRSTPYIPPRPKRAPVPLPERVPGAPIPSYRSIARGKKAKAS